MKVQYNDQQGIQVREYTQEIHGDNYKELAKEFASHIPGGKILDEVADNNDEIEETPEVVAPKRMGRPKKLNA